MTDHEKLEILREHVLKMHKEIVRTKAKLKALETMTRLKIPKNGHAAWDAKMKNLTQKILQRELEVWEKIDPAFAGWIDDRKADEMRELE